METVVKKDIVSIVAKNTNVNKDKVAVIVDSVFKTLTEYLKDANPEVRIEIRGFGVLGIKKAKAKPKARNPRTNEIIYETLFDHISLTASTLFLLIITFI